METGDEMVLVRDAWKTLGSKKVLRSLNMTVKKQAIYGLLGPSSCGKTTLLSCILGLKRLDAGNIDVKLRTLKEVGYMPQPIFYGIIDILLTKQLGKNSSITDLTLKKIKIRDPALYDNFTPEELCYFFGTFFGMNRTVIKERMNTLFEFLGLEECRTRHIGNCSGGQQRRTSLLITLLHDPKLLILDEPTVGLDCILSERIWQYMATLVNEGKTIIITTHYIQEAKNCTMIGLMRFGSILEEKPPSELMSLHNSSDLEVIFLEVCKLQDELLDQQPPETVPPKQLPKTKYSNYTENTSFDKNRFFALVYKNVLLTRRNTVALMGLLILPIFIAFIFSSVMGKNLKGVKLGVLSAELPFEEGLTLCETMTDKYFTELDCSLPEHFSCVYLEELKKNDIVLVPYDNNEELAMDIERNKVWGSLEFPQNFTESLIKRVQNTWKTPDNIVETSIVSTKLDRTNFVIKGILSNHILKTMEKIMNYILDKCGISEKNQIIPIRWNDPIYGMKEVALDQSAIPGFLVAFSFYCTIMFTSSTVISEKVQGMTERSIAGGMTFVEILFSHTVLQFLIMFLQNIGLFFSFYIFLDYVFKGSMSLAILLSMTVNCVGISLGFLLTEMFKTEFSAIYGAIGATISIFNLVGMFWPQEGMHYLLKMTLPLIPVTKVTNAMRSIIFRSYGISHPFVATGFLYNLVWSIVLITAAFIIHKLNK